MAFKIFCRVLNEALQNGVKETKLFCLQFKSVKKFKKEKEKMEYRMY